MGKLLRIHDICFTKGRDAMHCVSTLCIILFPILLTSQTVDTTHQLVYTKTNIRYFTVDPLQNVLAISNDDVLTKYDPQGNISFIYNNTVYGQLASVDATDPFNILLFFPEQQSIVLLDRTLNERSTLDLRETSIGLASSVALSLDNNIWVYDDFESQLVKMDENSNILLRSDNLRLTENIAEQANHIFRYKDKILVNFPTKGIAVFNLFAQLEKWWPLEGVLDGQVLSSGFAYHTVEGHFIYLPRPDLIETLNDVELGECSMIRTQFQQRYLLCKDGVLVKMVK